MSTLNSLKLLDSETQAKAVPFIEELKNKGFRFTVTETLRKGVVQEAYFAQGRDPDTKKLYKEMKFDTQAEREACEVKIWAHVTRMRTKAGLPPAGQKDALTVITYADGVKNPSRHQSGRALDIVIWDHRGRLWWGADKDTKGIETYQQIGAIGKGYGFEWGGDWKVKPTDPIGWDPFHFELP